MSTQTIERTDLDPVTGEPILSHIVKPKDGRPAAELVMEARIYGTPVEALCGHVWVPSRDPKQHPVCQQCMELFKEATGENDGWQES